MKKDLIKKIIISVFVGVPFLSSLISTIHLVDLFSLGNTNIMSWALAIAFELGSIASFLILTILDKVNKSMVMTIFVILISIQILGNIYYSFDFINIQLINDPNWLGSFQELISYIVAGNQTLMKLLVSMLVGVPIPLIALFFLKSLVDYLNVEEEEINDNISEDIFEKEPETERKLKIEPTFEKEPERDIEVKTKPKFEKEPETERKLKIEPTFEKEPERDIEVKTKPKFEKEPETDSKKIVENNNLDFRDKFHPNKEIKPNIEFSKKPISNRDYIQKKEYINKDNDLKNEIIDIEKEIYPENDKKDKKDTKFVKPSNVGVFQNNNLK